MLNKIHCLFLLLHIMTFDQGHFENSWQHCRQDYKISRIQRFFTSLLCIQLEETNNIKTVILILKRSSGSLTNY